MRYHHLDPREQYRETVRRCGAVLREQDAEARQIVISAISLDGPHLQIGTVQDLAALLASIHTEAADVVGPTVWAPSTVGDGYMVRLEYHVESDGSGYRVSITWQDGQTGHGFYTLPAEY